MKWRLKQMVKLFGFMLFMLFPAVLFSATIAVSVADFRKKQGREPMTDDDEYTKMVGATVLIWLSGIGFYLAFVF